MRFCFIVTKILPFFGCFSALLGVHFHLRNGYPPGIQFLVMLLLTYKEIIVVVA